MPVTVPKKTLRLYKELLQLWKPKAPMSVSEWADTHRVLAPESSSEPGPWRTDRVPYMREIMDAVNDPRYPEIAIMASAQVSKTELLLNIVGYLSDQEPCPILYMLPDKQLIRATSQERIAPMIKASPQLRRVFAAAKGRDASNTITKKSFPGGYLALVGANSPAALSSRPVRVVLADEVDRFPSSAGTEGDPVDLAVKRTTTFHNRKHVFVSTPLNEETSRINKLYQDSTRESYRLPCPECGEHNALRFANLKFDKNPEQPDEIIGDVECACSVCGAISSEKDWKAGEGRWIAERAHETRRGFYLNQIVSPWVTWKQIVVGFLKAKDDPESLKVWTNTVMGETWIDKAEKLDEEKLAERREHYEYDVPDGVKILAASIDTQDDRFEVEVKGWGAGRESWGIQYQVIPGDLNKPDVWNRLDEFLKRYWTDSQGRKYYIAAALMDSGGHFTGSVYQFCKAREHRKIWAMKGESRDDKNLPFFIGMSEEKRYKAKLMRINVDEGKWKVTKDLQRYMEGPGYCHFPLPDRKHEMRNSARGYDEDYFKGLTSEVLVREKRRGSIVEKWVKIRKRNEPLDLHVYNLALMEIMNLDLDEMEPYAFGESLLPTKPVMPLPGATRRRRGSPGIE